MVVLTDWQWALLAASGLTALVMGGWMRRQAETPQVIPGEAELDPVLETPAPAAPPPEPLIASAPATPAIQQELEDAREEAELLLLQLHQVQEELEHYFLLSRDLQAQLDGRQLASEPIEQLSQIKALRHRLEQLLQRRHRRDQHWGALLLRQHRALQRAKLLLQQQRQPARARSDALPPMVSEDIAFI